MKRPKAVNLVVAGIKRAVFSKKFLICVLMLALFAFLDCFPMFYSNSRIIDGKREFSLDLVEILLTASGGTMFWAFVFVIAAIPYSCVFYDDIRSNALTTLLMKGSRWGYAASAVIGCFISAFVCVFLGYSICLAVYLPFTGVWDMSSYSGVFITLRDGRYILFILMSVLLKSLEGAFFALIAMLISVYVKNRYVVLATPILVYYFISYAAGFYLKLPEYLDPYVIYSKYAFDPAKVSEVYSVLYAFAVTVIVSFGVCIAMRRRIKKCY